MSDVYKDKLTISWKPPENNGGTPVTGYYVERRSNTSNRWIFVNKEPIKDTKLVLNDLFEKTSYEFRISAENKVGTGTPSPSSAPVLTKDPWGKITFVKTYTLTIK